MAAYSSGGIPLPHVIATRALAPKPGTGQLSLFQFIRVHRGYPIGLELNLWRDCFRHPR